MRSPAASGEKVTSRFSTSRRLHALCVVRTNGGKCLMGGDAPRRVLLHRIVSWTDFLVEPALHCRIAFLQRPEAGANHLASRRVVPRCNLGIDEFRVLDGKAESTLRGWGHLGILFRDATVASGMKYPYQKGGA